MTGDDVFAAMHDDLRERELRGATTYENPRMLAGDGRDSLQDAYEEALDLAAYLKKLVLEREEPHVVVSGPATWMVHSGYVDPADLAEGTR